MPGETRAAGGRNINGRPAASLPGTTVVFAWPNAGAVKSAKNYGLQRRARGDTG